MPFQKGGEVGQVGEGGSDQENRGLWEELFGSRQPSAIWLSELKTFPWQGQFYSCEGHWSPFSLEAESRISQEPWASDITLDSSSALACIPHIHILSSFQIA